MIERVGENQKSHVWTLRRRSVDGGQPGGLYGARNGFTADEFLSADAGGLCDFRVEYVSHPFPQHSSPLCGKPDVFKVLEQGAQVVPLPAEIFAGS